MQAALEQCHLSPAQQPRAADGGARRAQGLDKEHLAHGSYI